MAEIAVIGSCWMEETIRFNKAMQYPDVESCQYLTFSSGDMRNVAHNLALLDADCIFCTKYGNDIDAVNMWNELNDLNVILLGPTVNEPTQRMINLYNDKQKKALLSDVHTFDFMPSDLIPYPAFASCEYGVTDIKNFEVLDTLFTKAPKTKWILSRTIPSKSILSRAEGLILTYRDIIALGTEKDFNRICYRFCAMGAKWVIVHMGAQGVFVYHNGEGTQFPSLYELNGYESGCYSAFVAGLTACLSKYQPLIASVRFAQEAEAYVYQVPTAINENIKEELMKG